MRILQLVFMALIFALVDCAGSPFSYAKISPQKYEETPPQKQVSADIAESPKKEPKKKFNHSVEVDIPIVHSSGDGELRADVFRPAKKILPKTLVIMVPGSGNVSRRGEVFGDGIDVYPESLEMNTAWANALSDRGYFVLTYDKRTCNSRLNSLCLNNDQKDIDQDGIVALSRDLDHIYAYASEKLAKNKEDVRIVLFSATQGAQTIALSSSAQSASGIVLLSPIIGDLSSMWVGGLTRAAEHTSSVNKKNRLLNQKESMIAFFASLNKGDFPETSNIRGASVQFWLSWMDASKNTMSYLTKNNCPTMLIFSDHDHFSGQNLISGLRKQANSKLKIKTCADALDRNFVSAAGVPETALKEVLAFIASLPSKMPAQES